MVLVILVYNVYPHGYDIIHVSHDLNRHGAEFTHFE